MRQQGIIKTSFFGLVTLCGFLALGVADVAAEHYLNTPDGRLTHLKEGTFQPDLSAYMSRLPEVKVIDRTFYPQRQHWAANEEFEFAMTGLSDMVRGAFPLANNPAFIWLTNQQFYWGARNHLRFHFGASHAGISLINGPYWTLKALEFSRYTMQNRDRGERVMSNKDIALQTYMPMFWKITGMPRPPDDPQPTYLEYESADPHFTAPIPISDTFKDPIFGKNGKWGVPEYFFNHRPFRWDRDGMVKYINLGDIGIVMKRASMWIDYMFKATHTGLSPSNQKKKIILQGNDAEEGFRGMILAAGRINAVLALKAELVADEEGNLGGINPATYDPKNGLRYFPHRIWPNMLLAGDAPERQWSFDINDARSLLFDQGALLWGISHFFQSTYRVSSIFTDNPPVDGGMYEKQLGVVPHYLANMIVKNIQAMHTRNGLLVSEWNPSKKKWWNWRSYGEAGSNHTLQMKDLTVAILGLSEYIARMRDPQALKATPDLEDLEPELTKIAEDLLTRNADFLLKVQGKDGSFCKAYNVATGDPAGPCDQSRANFFAIGVLAEAFKNTGEDKYTEAARKTWNYVWNYYWNETHGVFRSRLGDDTVIITPFDLAAQIRAWREMMFVTPIHMIKPMIDKMPRWIMQTMMLSGMVQSEENKSGELAYGVGSRDFDNDGVPWVGKSHGKFGIAPVLAAKVAINIGAPGQNEAFNALKGEKHSAEQFGGHIRYGYKPLPRLTAVKQMLLPVKMDYEALVDDGDWVERGELLRWDGTPMFLPPAKPFKRGSNLTGRQIFEMNCVHCHGYTGEGMSGISFEADTLERSRDDMFEVPNNGRFTRLMPEWGIGHSDEMESVLTDEEIYRIVDYIQSPKFRKMFVDTQKGYAYPDVPPKDPYFFISRSYVMGKKNAATEEDIALIMNAQMEAIRTRKPVNVIQRLLDAERAGGARGEIKKAGGFELGDYKLALSYTEEQSVRLALKPLEFPEKAPESAQQLEPVPPELEEAPAGLKSALPGRSEPRAKKDPAGKDAPRLAKFIIGN